MLSTRDPVHGFVRADALERALIDTRPLQGPRPIPTPRRPAPAPLDPAARLYDALAAKSNGLLDTDRRARERRLVRAAGLLHDVGRAHFSRSAGELCEG